jgi:hypothetical protein
MMMLCQEQVYMIELLQEQLYMMRQLHEQLYLLQLLLGKQMGKGFLRDEPSIRLLLEQQETNLKLLRTNQLLLEGCQQQQLLQALVMF